MVSNTTIVLYREHASNLTETMKFADFSSIGMIVTPIVNPLFYREFGDEKLSKRHLKFTRSDVVLEPNVWVRKIIFKLSDSIDCDSTNKNVRAHSEATFKQEINYAQHLASHGTMLLRIKGTNTSNLARVLTQNFTGALLLVEIPMIDPREIAKSYHADDTESNSLNGEDTWQWWNKFRQLSDYNNRFKVALELSSDLPSTEEINRWLGEPVDLLVIRSDLFILNRSNYPVLSRAHQAVVLKFLDNNANLALKANSDDPNILQQYFEYLQYLVRQNKLKENPIPGYDDLLELPLQPLSDNLDCYTYEIFERDPVKYILYQRAIEQALMDRIEEKDIESTTAVVMVVGAGRGPLVRSAMNASANSKRNIKIYVIEKNPNAIQTLMSLKEELWANKDLTIIPSDMRDFDPVEKADILVSELLGSFGDNELSPECLDGAQKHLKDDGISIPCKSTSYINPIMSQKLFNVIRETRVRSFRGNLTTIEQQTESTYVVYLKNIFHISPHQKLFTFVHPNRDEIIDNSRYASLTFDVSHDCLLNGFAGYFDTVLYKDITISIAPDTHTKGLSSWFPMFFPISEAQNLKAGDKLVVHFWRSISERHVWYEWNISAPTISHIHNAGGRSCSIAK